MSLHLEIPVPLPFMLGTVDYSWHGVDEIGGSQSVQSVLHFKTKKNHRTVLYTQRNDHKSCYAKTHGLFSHALKHAREFESTKELHDKAIQNVKETIIENVVGKRVELYEQKCEGTCGVAERTKCDTYYHNVSGIGHLKKEGHLEKVTDSTKITEEQIIHTLDRINDKRYHHRSYFEKRLLEIYAPVVQQYENMANEIIKKNDDQVFFNDQEGGKIHIYVPSRAARVILGTASNEIKRRFNTEYQIVSFYSQPLWKWQEDLENLKINNASSQLTSQASSQLQSQVNPGSLTEFPTLGGSPQRGLHGGSRRPSQSQRSQVNPQGSRKSSILLWVKDFLGLY